MATQSTGGGSAVEFGNAIKAQPDVYSTAEDALGVDGTHIILLDVTSNDSMSGGKTLYSLDDGRVSSRAVRDGDADLLTKDTVYPRADLLTADHSTSDTSFLGASVWITSDGKVAYDTSSPAITALAFGQTATDSFVYAIRLGNELYWSTVTLTITGTNDAPALSTLTTQPTLMEAAGASGSNTQDTVHATFSFSDVDLADTHYTGASATTVVWSGGSNLSPLLYNDLTFAAQATVVQDTTHGGPGVIDIGFSVRDADFDFLAQGETLKVSYNLNVTDNWAATSAQPVTFTVTGANDTPYFPDQPIFIPGFIEVGGASGSAGLDSAAAIYTFRDNDFNDTHTVGISYAGAGFFGFGALNLPAGLDEALAAAATATLIQDSVSANGQTNVSGQINFAFSAADKTFDFLAQGQILKIAYNLTVTDDWGASVAQPVAFLVFGTNDVPRISASSPVGFGERFNDTGDILNNDQANASFTFTDADLTDYHWVSLSYVGSNWSSGLSVPLAAGQVLYNAAHATMGSDSTDGGTGQVNVAFSAADATFDFLGFGETLNLTYIVSVDDGHGASPFQLITFTATGTNDAPVLAADPNGPHIFNEIPGVTGSTQPDFFPASLNFTDRDFNDQHTGSLSNPTIVWSGGSVLPPGVAVGVSSGTFFGGVATFVGGGGYAALSFVPRDSTFDFLAAGETLTITYNVTVTDSQGASSTQPITYIVIGTNDTPQITSAPFSVSIAELPGHLGDTTSIDSANALIAFTDPDLKDTHATPNLAFASVVGPHVTAALQATLASAAHVSSFQDSTNVGQGQLNVAFGAFDNLFDFLSVGEQLRITYNVTVTDNHGASVIRPVVFLVSGTNDAPLLGPDTAGPHIVNEELGLTGSSDVHTALATLAYSDPDLDDSHGFSSSPSLTWSGGSTNSLGLLASSISSALKVTTTDSQGGGSGSVQLAMSLADSNFDFLAQGETLTLVDNVSILDGHGGVSAVRPVTFIISGANDAPVLAADAVAHAVNGRASDVTGASTLDAGRATLRFTDFDFDDTHTVSFGPAAAVLSTGGDLPSGLQDLLNGAVLASMSDSTHVNLTAAVNDSAHIGRGTGSISVSFSAADSAFDFLAPGQSLTVSYDVTVTDNHGASSTQAVTFTVSGTNYDAVFALSGASNLAGTAAAEEFVFGSPIGADTIGGFDPAHDTIDLIGFAGFANFAEIQAHIADNASADAVITLGNGQSITLIGVTTAVLTSGNFVFDKAPALFNTGTLTVGDGAIQSLSGQVVNTGTIALASAGNPTGLVILRNGATLTGQGQIILSDSDQNLIYGVNPALELINVDNTIVGEGQIGGGSLTLINEGAIWANGTHALLIDTGSNAVVNSGRIATTGAGGMTINGAVDNSGMLETFGSLLHIMGPVTGSGVAIIGGGTTVQSTLEFSAASSTAVTFAALNGLLKLDDPTEFTGRVSNFNSLGHIDLVGIASSAAVHYLADADGSGGVLTVNDGIHSANIGFIGQNLSAHFRLVDDHLGGSLIGYF